LVEVGKLADIIMCPPFFGTKHETIHKGGFIAFWADIGDANASIPTLQPNS